MGADLSGTSAGSAASLGAAPELSRLRALLDVPPPIAYSIRFAVAVTVALGIGKLPGLIENNSTWILITVLVVLQPTTGGSLMKCVSRALGTILAAFTAIVLFGLYSQDPPLLLTAMFLVQLASAYGFSGPRFPYAYFVFGLTSTIVLGDALAGNETIETIAFQRATMVGIGILIVFVTDSLLWPARAELKLRRSLASRAKKIASAIRSTLFAGTPREDETVAENTPDGLAVQLALATAVRSELGASSGDADTLGRVILLLQSLDSRSRELAHRIGVGDTGLAATSSAILTPLGRLVGAALEESAEALAESRGPVPFADALEVGFLDLESHCRDLAERGELDPSSSWRGLVADLRDLVAILCRLEKLLLGDQEVQAAVDSGSPFSFRLDPFRMKVALRTATAVLVSLLAVMMLGWPMNTLVAPVSFIVACLTRAKALQSVVGLTMVIGLGWFLADLMIVFVTPYTGRAPVGFIAAFACAGGLAYVATRYPALAMLPSIGGLIAILSAFGGSAASTDVYGAYNTVCYMALAIGTGWIFSRTMWPATAASLFRERVAAQIEACLEAIRETREASARSRPLIAADLVRACAREAAALGPLHDQARKEPVERALDETRRAQLLTLPTDLMDATLSDRPREFADLSNLADGRYQPLLDAIREEDTALEASLEYTIALLRGRGAESSAGLNEAQQRVESRLDDLREAPVVAAELPGRQKHSILVAIDARRRLVSRQTALEDWVEDWRRSESEPESKMETQ